MPHPGPPELVVTNLNRNFTGVSATIDQLLRHQERDHKVLFCGNPLPAVRAKPVSVREALSRSRRSPSNRPFVIWHVRRNCEMFWSLVARDILKLPIKTVFTSAAIRRHSAFPRFLISKMDAVIATSPKAATFIDRNLAATVPHGVDTERFYPLIIASKHGKRLVFLVVVASLPWGVSGQKKVQTCLSKQCFGRCLSVLILRL